MTTVVTYSAPRGVALTADLSIEVAGSAVPVYRCQVLDHAGFSCDGPVEIVITARAAIGAVTIRPLHRGATHRVDGQRLIIAVDRPRQLYVEIAGHPPLALFIDPLETDVPDPNARDVVYFGPGLHEPGTIELSAGQTLYLAGGAVVHGHVRARGPRITIRGRGILDGTRLPDRPRLIVLDGCDDAVVEGITTVGTPSWNLVIGASERVRVSRVKLIGWVVTSDGIDVVGSRDVTVEDCFLRNNDDCVAVKAVDYGLAPERKADWLRDVARLRVRRCVCYNDSAGNALEIGFETRCESISDILFEDLDIIGAHGNGGVFTIHNGDRAAITDVTYRDIRVEHFWDLLVDIRVLHSRYSKDERRGTIKGVRFERIATIKDPFNIPSLIGGFDPEHPVEDVVFDDFRIGEQRIRGADDLHLFTRNARGIVYR